MVAPKQSTAVQEEELGLAEKLISSTSIIYQVWTRTFINSIKSKTTPLILGEAGL